MLTFRPTARPKDFIAYLNAAIRDSKSWSQDANETTHGVLVEDVTWVPKELGEEVRLRLTWGVDENDPEAIGVSWTSSPDWPHVVEELLRRIDARAQDPLRTRFDTQHRYAYVGRNLSGFFQLGTVGIQPWHYPDQHGVNVERALLITLPIDAVDAQEAQSASQGLASEVIGFLSLLWRFGFYTVRRDLRWTVDGRHMLAFPEGKPDAVPTGRVDDHELEIDLPIHQTRGNELGLPRFAEALWHQLQSLDSEPRTRFGRASSLFNLACIVGRYVGSPGTELEFAL